MAIYHVYPLNDTKEHDLESTCECNPVAETQPGGDIILVHNSWDGREAVEVAQEIINNPVSSYNPLEYQYGKYWPLIKDHLDSEGWFPDWILNIDAIDESIGASVWALSNCIKKLKDDGSMWWILNRNDK